MLCVGSVVRRRSSRNTFSKQCTRTTKLRSWRLFSTKLGPSFQNFPLKSKKMLCFRPSMAQNTSSAFKDPNRLKVTMLFKATRASVKKNLSLNSRKCSLNRVNTKSNSKSNSKSNTTKHNCFSIALLWQPYQPVRIAFNLAKAWDKAATSPIFKEEIMQFISNNLWANLSR